MGGPRPPSRLLPPSGKTLLLVGQDTASIDGYAWSFGTPVGFSVYVDDIDSPLDGLSRPCDRGAGENFAAGLLDKYGRATALNLAIGLVDMEERVARGERDGAIQTIADWARGAAVPIYMRVGYEFDGDWNRYEPAPYVEAYRRFVDIFRAAGVPNVLFVWHSAAATMPYGGHSRMEWYPGDSYVDVFALSLFTALYSEGNPHAFLKSSGASATPRDLESFAALASEHGRPLMIAESTPRNYHLHTEGPEAWREFFVPVFDFIERFDVSVFAYINCNWDAQPRWRGSAWGDSRLEWSSDDVFFKWGSEVRKPRWQDPLGRQSTTPLPAAEPTTAAASEPCPPATTAAPGASTSTLVVWEESSAPPAMATAATDAPAAAASWDAAAWTSTVADWAGTGVDAPGWQSRPASDEGSSSPLLPGCALAAALALGALQLRACRPRRRQAPLQEGLNGYAKVRGGPQGTSP